MKRIVQILCILFFALPFRSYAAQPMEVLRRDVDEVLSILSDPAYRAPSKAEEQQEKIWDIIDNVFNFNEMARSTAARHWKSFSESQKKEFTEVFGKFLGETYLDKISSGYKGEKVKYVGQDMMTDTRAKVETKIIREDKEIPVDYGMMLRDGRWQIYDVKIEGVSLINNYRSQFHSILLNESPEELIDRLKKKLEEE